eukprot:scaffold1643_cov87-Skeletonema_dohrnii-CCMP3373.AAC.1
MQTIPVGTKTSKKTSPLPTATKTSNLITQAPAQAPVKNRTTKTQTQITNHPAETSMTVMLHLKASKLLSMSACHSTNENENKGKTGGSRNDNSTLDNTDATTKLRYVIKDTKLINIQSNYTQ